MQNAKFLFLPESYTLFVGGAMPAKKYYFTVQSGSSTTNSCIRLLGMILTVLAACGHRYWNNVKLFQERASAIVLCTLGTCTAGICIWKHPHINAKYLSRCAISFTLLDWLIAAMAALLII